MLSHSGDDETKGERHDYSNLIWLQDPCVVVVNIILSKMQLPHKSACQGITSELNFGTKAAMHEEALKTRVSLMTSGLFGLPLARP